MPVMDLIDIDIDTNNLIDPNKSYSFVAERFRNQITQLFLVKILLILKIESLIKYQENI